MSRVLYGSQIRTFELAKNLNIQLVHSDTKTRMLKYIRSAATLARHKDVILFGSRSRFFDQLFFRTLKKYGISIIYDVADLPHLQNHYFWGTAIDANLARRFYSLISLADTLILVSSSARNLLTPHEVANRKTLIVPNGSDPDFFKATPLQTETKVLLYVGGYAVARGVDDLVAAFNILSKKYSDIRLRLVGQNMPLKFQSDRVSVERDKTYKDMPRVYRESYLFIIPHRRNPYMDAALPVKLFDAMSSARPIIVTDCAEMKRIVEKEKCGVVTHDSSESLAQGIEFLIQKPQLAEEMGKRGRHALAKRHSWKCRAETIKKGLV